MSKRNREGEEGGPEAIAKRYAPHPLTCTRKESGTSPLSFHLYEVSVPAGGTHSGGENMFSPLLKTTIPHGIVAKRHHTVSWEADSGGRCTVSMRRILHQSGDRRLPSCASTGRERTQSSLCLNAAQLPGGVWALPKPHQPVEVHSTPTANTFSLRGHMLMLLRQKGEVVSTTPEIAQVAATEGNPTTEPPAEQVEPKEPRGNFTIEEVSPPTMDRPPNWSPTPKEGPAQDTRSKSKDRERPSPEERHRRQEEERRWVAEANRRHGERDRRHDSRGDTRRNQDDHRGRQVERERMGRPANLHTPTPARLEGARTCNLYYAPKKQETLTIAGFVAAASGDHVFRGSGILWAKASKRDELIKLPVDNETQYQQLAKHLLVGDRFYCVSYTGADIAQTAEWERHIERLAPLVVSPLPTEKTPEEAAGLVWARSEGARPYAGPITNAERLAPAKAFRVRAWTTQKRNQILRHPFIENPCARITVEIPKGWTDETAVLIISKNKGTMSTSDVEGLVESYAGHLPRPAAVVQIFDWISEVEIDKWFLAFEDRTGAAAFHRDRMWINHACSATGLQFTVAKCTEAAAQTTPHTKKAATRGKGAPPRGKRGRGK